MDLLYRQIEDAFSFVKYPATDRISVETYDDEGTADHFCNTSWQDHELEETSVLCSCLWYFTPKAFCYFLPAFMLASLRSPVFMTECWGNILAQLVPTPSSSDSTRPKEILSRLSHDQRILVLQFLKSCNDGGQDPQYLNAIKSLQDAD